jgi:hypothetical protein
MLEDSITCPPHPDFPFYVSAKRYYASSTYIESAHTFKQQEITLILLHSTSFHKEIWEPTITALFKLLDGTSVRIKEAYTIDCPNHGVSAVLNENLLKNYECKSRFSPPPTIISFVAHLTPQSAARSTRKPYTISSSIVA